MILRWILTKPTINYMGRYDAMRANGKLPETNDPNWHLGKLKPWMHHQV